MRRVAFFFLIISFEDISDVKISYARDNIVRNGLSENIDLIKVDPMKEVIPTKAIKFEVVYDFLMCNPPFYKSLNERKICSKNKKTLKKSSGSGTHTDLTTLGGEIRFVLRIIAESQDSRHKIR